MADENGKPRLSLSIPLTREGVLILFAVIGTCIATVAKVGAYIQELRDQVATESRERRESDERVEHDAQRALGTVNEKLDTVLAQHRLIIDRTFNVDRRNNAP